MSNLGYSFESEIEGFFLKLTGKKREDAIIKGDGSFNRSFRIPNSGAMKSIKGDIIAILPWIKKFLKIECKHRYEYTKKKGQHICILKEWIDKNNVEAEADNQIPLLSIAFKRERNGRIWFITEPKYFEELKPYLNFIPSQIRIDGCINEGKSEKNPCIYLYKNNLLKSIDFKNYLEIGRFLAWNRIFYVISKYSLHHLLCRLLMDDNSLVNEKVPEGNVKFVVDGETILEIGEKK